MIDLDLSKQKLVNFGGNGSGFQINGINNPGEFIDNLVLFVDEQNVIFMDEDNKPWRDIEGRNA